MLDVSYGNHTRIWTLVDTVFDIHARKTNEMSADDY